MRVTVIRPPKFIRNILIKLFEKTEFISKECLQNSFKEFEPFIGKCRFDDCAHIKEPGCAILEAMANGIISRTRHESYVRLYEMASLVKSWELK